MSVFHGISPWERLEDVKKRLGGEASFERRMKDPTRM